MERSGHFRPLRQPLVVWGLIGGLLAGQGALSLMPHHDAVMLTARLAVWPERPVAEGASLSPLTYAVVHQSWLHVTVVAAGLLTGAGPVARLLDRREGFGLGLLFWVLLAVAALGGAGAHLWLAGLTAPGLPLVGALPLVFGLWGAGPVLAAGGPLRALQHRGLSLRLGLVAVLGVALAALPAGALFPYAGAGALGGLLAGIGFAALIVRTRPS